MSLKAILLNEAINNYSLNLSNSLYKQKPPNSQGAFLVEPSGIEPLTSTMPL
jgi:hypothetical protein